MVKHSLQRTLCLVALRSLVRHLVLLIENLEDKGSVLTQLIKVEDLEE